MVVLPERLFDWSMNKQFDSLFIMMILKILRLDLKWKMVETLR